MYVRVSESSIVLGLAFGILGVTMKGLTWLLIHIPLLGWLGIAAGTVVALLGGSPDLSIWIAIAVTLGTWAGRWIYDVRTGGPRLSERYFERFVEHDSPTR